MKTVIGITGASGSIYALRLIKRLLDRGVEVAVIFTDNGRKVWQWELDEDLPQTVEVFDNKNLFAPMSSGSSDYDAMIVCPCSMGTLGKIANGISDNLLTRSADVMLKERKKLILVPREMPYNLQHLENMRKITLSGGIIIPASPAFYSKPGTIEQLVDTVIDKVISQLGFAPDYRWNGKV